VSKALLVATGIFLSRLAGLVRLRVFAHYFGLQSDAADAFNAGFRIPNLLQNLFGEGALSASFIPVYASLVSSGDRRAADRVAGAVGAVLALVVAVIVLAGVLAAPAIVAVVAPGFTGDKRTLTVAIVRILFPGAGLLVLSAWCLGVLNSHHRFLLSYTAPVMWNVAMIATLVAFGAEDLPRLAVLLAWGSVVGSAMQVLVQVPAVLRVAPHMRLVWDTHSTGLRAVGRNFVPVVISRGVVQISAFIDALIASWLPTGAVTGLANAQLLYTLPVSLFGMSVAAAELPAMSGEAAAAAGTSALRARLDTGLRHIAFFIVPSAVAFFALGDVIAAALLQTGRFRYEDAVYVWLILAGAAIGLLPTTLGRLYASAYYALRDTRTPLRYALAHVLIATVLGYWLAVVLPPRLGLPLAWGAAGLTGAAGIAAWIELLMLRGTLNGRIGGTGLPIGYALRLWLSALVAAGLAWTIKLSFPASHPIIVAVAVLLPYGLAFVGVARILGVAEVSLLLRRIGLRGSRSE
jgi:putative peptidoglycan lipid II flippase